MVSKQEGPGFHQRPVEDNTLQKGELEARVQAFLSLAARKVQPPCASIEETTIRMREVLSHLIPTQEGAQLLQTAHSFIPPKQHELSNGDHNHAVWFRDTTQYKPKRGPEVIVSKLPPTSSRNLSLHSHEDPTDPTFSVIEYKYSPFGGLTIVTFSPQKGFRLEKPLPTEVYGSREEEWHSIRNDAPYPIYSIDLIFVIKK